jgi:hypothetical protein
MPAAIEDKSAIISHQVILFAMIALPFFLLPYNAAMLYGGSSYSLPSSTIAAIPNMGQILPDAQSAAQQQHQLQNPILKLPVLVLNPPNKEEPSSEGALFWFNLSLCLLIITTTGIKSVMKYRLVPLYSVLCVIGGLFLIASYTYSTLPLLTGFSVKPIEWRGRTHHLPLHYNEKNKTI